MSQTRVTVKDQNIAVVSISKGFIGPPGRAATATAGTTTTGAEGASASVTNVGTLFDSVFDFVIPKGDTGDAATISVGTVTALTPDQNPTVINSGTSGAAVLDFGLPTASTIDLGVVTIVNPDQNPSITDVGVSGDVVLDINIPRAADVTVQPAVTLTPDQNPSVADNGTNGDVNLTFSIPRAAAVNVNAVTTVNPNVNPSVADTGINGDVDLTFSIPRAAALDLGTITVVTPDQNPSITDVGTNGDAEFNFSLPRAATITLEPTTVLTPNLDPSVADTGTNGDAVYTFSIPRASVVSLGTVSVLNPDQNPAVTSTVVSGDIAYNFAIPRAADVSVGTVTTGAPGSQATVLNTGINGDVELNFSIPEGEKGDQGDAATLNLGTVSVVNPDQNPGITNSGTQSDAVFDFNLPKASDVSLGDVTVVNPDQNPSITDVGINGDVLLNVDLPRAPDFTVGAVTTGNAGTNASITDVGTNGDIALNFTIPRGEKGDTGEALKILGTLPDVGSLPVTGNEGDAFIIDGDLYVWNETDGEWVDVGSIAGPGVALGGTTNQSLTKLSNDDFDTQWVTLTNSDVGLGNVPNLDTTDAVNKSHDQNTDTVLNQGGANEVTAADARAHIDATDNPHGVTKSQVGLGDVDNVSAANLRDRSTHTGTQPLSTISDAGNMGLQNKESVNITGGSVSGITDLEVADGGTGASTLASGEVLIGNGTDAVTTESRSGIDTRSTFPPSAHTHVSTDITDFETAVQSASPAPNNPTITIDAGDAIDGGGTFTLDQANAATITLDHANTSSQGSVSNSGSTVIQSVSLDGFGHVTNLASKTLTSSDVGAEPSFSTLAVNKGGTGRTTHTSGNVLLGNGTGGFNSVSRSGVDTRSTFPPSAHNHTTANITSGTFSVARGGTGRSTLTNNAVLVGNGGSAVSLLSRSGIDTRTSFPADLPTTAGAVGTYAFAWARVGFVETVNKAFVYGETASGSLLRPAAFSNFQGFNTAQHGWFDSNFNLYGGGGTNVSTLSGTWRCMGQTTPGQINRDYPHTLWLRIS